LLITPRLTLPNFASARRDVADRAASILRRNTESVAPAFAIALLRENTAALKPACADDAGDARAQMERVSSFVHSASPLGRTTFCVQWIGDVAGDTWKEGRRRS
jgi:hypothetical protein